MNRIFEMEMPCGVASSPGTVRRCTVQIKRIIHKKAASTEPRLVGVPTGSGPRYRGGGGASLDGEFHLERSVVEYENW
jgi:hypothetical protein